MDKLRNFFKKKQPEPVLQTRRRQKRPAPAPPIPNTPQIQATTSQAPPYDPPSGVNLFAGYKFADNVLNPWDRPDESQPASDPVASSEQAWNQYDRQRTYNHESL